MLYLKVLKLFKAVNLRIICKLFVVSFGSFMARLHWRFLLRFQIARVSYWRLQPFESPVVYRGEIALEIAAQIVKSRLKSQQN